MATNFPGPYELEIFLQVTSVTPVRNHVIRTNIVLVGTPDPGTLFSAITVQKRGGGTATLAAATDLLWSFYRLVFSSTIQVNEVILWKYVTGTFAKDFVSSYVPANPTGSGTGVQAAQQCTLSFRTANGGILKIVLLEPTFSGDTRTNLVPNPTGTSVQRIASYVLSADSIVFGRDDSYPIAALRDSRGQNEAVWRSIFR